MSLVEFSMKLKNNVEFMAFTILFLFNFVQLFFKYCAVCKIPYASIPF